MLRYQSKPGADINNELTVYHRKKNAEWMDISQQNVRLKVWRGAFRGEGARTRRRFGEGDGVVGAQWLAQQKIPSGSTARFTSPTRTSSDRAAYAVLFAALIFAAEDAPGKVKAA